jgi:hypothetical protein
MNSTRLSVNKVFNSRQRECSPEHVAERLFERSLTFAEIADLSEKCNLWTVEGYSDRSPKSPITFTIPTTQLLASISRVVE